MRASAHPHEHHTVVGVHGRRVPGVGLRTGAVRNVGEGIDQAGEHRTVPVKVHHMDVADIDLVGVRRTIAIAVEGKDYGTEHRMAVAVVEDIQIAVDLVEGNLEVGHIRARVSRHTLVDRGEESIALQAVADTLDSPLYTA